MSVQPAEAALPSFVSGRGHPLVYLPGLAFSHALPTGLARLAERSLFGPLACRHRVHWLGRRPDVPDGFTIADFAQDCAAFLRSRVDHPLDVVGMSTGGFLGLQLALDHPELVRRLVVIGAGSRLTEAGATFERQLLEALEGGRTAAAWRVLGADVAPNRAFARPAAAVAGALGPFMSPDDLRDAAATARADLAFDLTAQLGSIHVPTLFVSGCRDKAFDAELARATWSGIPYAELLLLPHTGHLGSAMHPRAAARIHTFLAVGRQ